MSERCMIGAKISPQTALLLERYVEANGITRSKAIDELLFFAMSFDGGDHFEYGEGELPGIDRYLNEFAGLRALVLQQGRDLLAKFARRYEIMSTGSGVQDPDFLAAGPPPAVREGSLYRPMEPADKPSPVAPVPVPQKPTEPFNNAWYERKPPGMSNREWNKRRRQKPATQAG